MNEHLLGKLEVLAGRIAQQLQKLQGIEAKNAEDDDEGEEGYYF